MQRVALPTVRIVRARRGGGSSCVLPVPVSATSHPAAACHLPPSAQDHVNESRHSEFGGRPIPRSRSHSPLRSQDPVAYHRRASPPVVVPHPFSHPHSLSEVVQEALDVERGHGGVAGSGPTAAAGGGQGTAAVGRLSNT